MPKLPAALLLALLLTACAAPQAIMPPQSPQSFLPLIANSTEETAFFVVSEVPYADIEAVIYPGDGLIIPIHWGKVVRDGWTETDAKVGEFRGPLSAVILGAPSFVTLGPTCAPIPRYAWGAAADFMAAVADRYPNLVRIQVGNEPDTSDSYAEWWLGCWGDTAAEGEYFIEFANYVHDRLAASHPYLTVIAGGYAVSTSDFSVAAIQGDRTDGVAVHHYTWCSDVVYPTALRSYIASLTDQPAHLTETGLLYTDPDNLTCQRRQANYVWWTIQCVWGFESCGYYNIGCRPEGHGWNNCEIFGVGCERKPASDAYQGR